MTPAEVRDRVHGVLAFGAVVSLGGKFAGRFLGVVGDIVAARLLGPASFGLYAIGWTLLRTLGLIAPLGLASGVLRYVPELQANNPSGIRELLRKTFVTVAVFGIALGAALWLCSHWLAQAIYGKPALESIFKFFAVSIPFASVLSVAGAAARSRGDMRFAALFEDIGQPLVGLAILLLLIVLAEISVGSVIAADVGSFIVTACLGVLILRSTFRHELSAKAGTPIPFSQVMQYSLATALAGTLAVLVFWVDRLLVGYYLSPLDNGLYQAASQSSVLFVLVLASFNAILAPIFASDHARGDVHHLEETFRVGTKWGLYLSIPIFFVFCFASREALTVLYGPNYEEAWRALLILAVGQIVNVATGAVGPLLTMTGHQGAWLRLCLVALLANFGLCWILIPRYGIEGAALSTAVTLDVMYLVAVFEVKKLMKIWPYDARYFKGLFSAAAAALPAAVCGLALRGTPLVQLLAVGLASTAVFFGVLGLLGLDKEDEELLGIIRHLVGFRKAV